MENKSAAVFVRKLFAGCPNYRASKEVREDASRLYLDKLSRWHMTVELWESALDSILAANLQGELPPLSVIYDALKSSQVSAVDKGNGGWCTFTMNGYRKSIRIKAVDGSWKELEHYLDMHPKGEADKWPFGKRIWTDNAIELRLPAGAEDVRYHPDNEAFTQ